MAAVFLEEEKIFKLDTRNTTYVIAAVDEVKEKIISGEVTVPSNKEEFEAAHGDVYELD